MSKKQNKNMPLSKKQRKKLAKQGVKATPKTARAKMSKVQKWTVALVSMICAFAMVCAVFGGILISRAIKAAKENSIASSYESLTMERFFHTDQMGKAFYTMNAFDFSGINTAYAPKDMAYMDAYVEDLCFDHRKLVKAGQRQTVVGKGDEVALYVIGAYNDKGERIPADDMHLQSYINPWMWQNSSTGAYGLPVIGAGDLGGESFDDALIALNVKPADTYREIRQNGMATMDDIVCVSYQLYKQKADTAVDDTKTDPVDKYTWSTTTAASKSGMRVTLSDAKEIDQTIAAALIANLPELGEDYSFVLENYNPTGNDTDLGVYRVDANIHFVVEDEKYIDVTFTADEDFFKEGDGESLTQYNGKELTFRLILLSSNDYEIPAFDRKFITETLQFEVKATDDAGAVAEYKTKQLAIINEDLAETKRSQKISQMYLNLMEKAQKAGYLHNTDYPSSLADSVRESAFKDLQNRYISLYGQTPTEESLNNFAASYAASLAGAQITSYAEYLELVVQSQVPQELIMYYIFRDAGLEVTDEEIDAEFEARLATYLENTDDPETYTREYFINYYGGETEMKKQIRHDLVYETVGTYLLENNTEKAS